MLDVDQIDVVTVLDIADLSGLVVLLGLIFILDDGLTRVLGPTAMYVWLAPCEMWVVIVFAPIQTEATWVGVVIW